MIFNTVSVIAILAAIQPAVAFWRLQCFGVVGIARVDPLVNPNELAAHVHTIKGGNGKTTLTSHRSNLREFISIKPGTIIEANVSSYRPVYDLHRR